ncbi:MAG: DUF4943 family protein [Candidatus Cyclobacteriaceae bacterium M2_1C_046]
MYNQRNPMKLILYYLFPALISIIGCNSAEQRTAEINRFTYPDIDAQEYIEQLKANSYRYYTLPKFHPDNIHFLMNYVSDTTHIDTFPVNPISSFRGQDSYVGFIVMWTIENIRSNYPYSDNLLDNYPSQYPAPYDTVMPHSYLKNFISFDEVSLYYQNWWTENSNKPFAEYKNIDPLANTKYKW